MRPFDLRILRLLPASRRPVLVLGCLGVGNGVLAIAQAFAIAAVVMAVVTGGDLSGPVTGLVLVAAARALTGAAIENTAARAGVQVSTALREAVLERALDAGSGAGVPLEGGADAAEARSGPAGSLPAVGRSSTAMRTLAVHGASSVEPYVARFLPAMISATVLPVLAIATIAVVDWPSALIVVCTVPLLPVFAALIGRATADATQQRWRALRALSGHFVDVVR